MELLQDKRVKRALWTFLNSLMALVVSGITYYATQNVEWAVVILPIAHIFSQLLTKELNVQ